MLCALIFAMVVALFLLAAAGRTKEDPRKDVNQGCKPAAESQAIGHARIFEIVGESFSGSGANDASHG